MVNSILLEKLNTQTLKELFKDCVKELIKDNSLKSQLQEINTYIPDELLTRKETCKFLQIDSSTLWHWTNKGKVTAYGIANRRYYKKAELLESLKPLKK